jgi:hypothetical protein
MISFRLAAAAQKKGCAIASLQARHRFQVLERFLLSNPTKRNLQDETLYPFPFLFSFLSCMTDGVRCVREKESRSGEFEGFWSLINRRIVEEVGEMRCGDGFVGDYVN